MNIRHTIPNAFGRNETVIVETETDETRYTFHVTDGEIEKVGWENKDHSDYGTKLIVSVDEEDKQLVLEAARNA